MNKISKGLCFSVIKNLKFKKHAYTGGGWILRTNKIRSRLNSRKILRNVVSISQEFCWRTFFFGGFWGYLTLFLVPNSTDLGTGVVSSSKTRCCFAHSKIDCRHARVPINHKMSLKLWGQDSGRGGTNQSSARLELGLDAKKALILGSKLGSGSKGLGSSSIQFWKFRLGPTYRGGTESNFLRLRLASLIWNKARARLGLDNWKLGLDSVSKISARSPPYL